MNFDTVENDHACKFIYDPIISSNDPPSRHSKNSVQSFKISYQIYQDKVDQNSSIGTKMNHKL